MFFNFFHGLITYDEKAWQYILFTIRSFYFDYIKKRRRVFSFSISSPTFADYYDLG